MPNRPLPSSKNPHFQNEAKCATFLVREWIIISSSKAEHLTSFWYRCPGKLGNGLFYYHPLLVGTGPFLFILFSNTTHSPTHTFLHCLSTSIPSPNTTTATSLFSRKEKFALIISREISNKTTKRTVQSSIIPEPQYKSFCFVSTTTTTISVGIFCKCFEWDRPHHSYKMDSLFSTFVWRHISLS